MNDGYQHPPQAQDYHPSHQSQPMSTHQVTIVREQSAPKGCSVASMVLGLVSIFLGWTFIAPVIGLILGIIGARKEPAGRGMAITGIILSSIVLLGWVLVLSLLFSIGMAGVAGSQ